MSVDDVFKIILFATNNTISGDISKGEFNRAIALAENSYVNYLLGQPEQYQYQRPIPRIQYSFNQNIRQKLTPLIAAPTTLTIDGSGNANYPADYITTDAMYTSAMGKIRFASQDKLHSYIDSTIDPIATNPIFLIQNGRFQFYPITLGSAKLSYVKEPAVMFWNSSTDGNGREVYNPTGSTQPLWSEVDLFEVISRCLKIVGVNLQLPILYQYAEQVKKEGA